MPRVGGALSARSRQYQGTAASMSNAARLKSGAEGEAAFWVASGMVGAPGGAPRVRESRTSTPRRSRLRLRQQDAWSLLSVWEGTYKSRTVPVLRPLLSAEICRMDAQFAGGRSQPHTTRVKRGQETTSGRFLRVRGECRRIQVNIACERHKARETSEHQGGVLAGTVQQIHLDILIPRRLRTVAADDLADISDPARKVPIEIEEGLVESSARRAPIVLVPASPRPISRIIGLPRLKRRVLEIRNDGPVQRGA